jgi:hypothetical protein
MLGRAKRKTLNAGQGVKGDDLLQVRETKRVQELLLIHW